MPQCFITVLRGSYFSIGLLSCGHVCVTKQSADVTLAWPFKWRTLFERAWFPPQYVWNKPGLSWSVQRAAEEHRADVISLFLSSCGGCGAAESHVGRHCKKLSPEVRGQKENSDTHFLQIKKLVLCIMSY